eukprot:COSAG02_NODE_2002_length_10139_cov_4.784761_10_plen_73_part_00
MSCEARKGQQPRHALRRCPWTPGSTGNGARRCVKWKWKWTRCVEIAGESAAGAFNTFDALMFCARVNGSLAP